MKLFYSPAYTLAGYSFDTTRKSGWIAESLAIRPVPGIEIEAPIPATEEQVRWMHGAEYVGAVRTGEPRSLAESQDFTWDPGLWPMVLASTGGVMAAALTAMRDGVAGSLSSGLHHARRDAGAGYCTFNGLAIAARAALDAAAESVLILDLDAHCGGGTHSLVADDPRIWHADVAVDAYDRYQPGDRCSLSLVDHVDDYLPEVERCLDGLERQAPRFGLCLYNAGMDPFAGCAIGGLPGITLDVLRTREEMVFAWCRRREIPMAFVLAGGYIGSRLDQETLVELHRLTVAAALGGGTAVRTGDPSLW
ncbi:MAG TPA: hypothetical protein VIJ28_24620 [Chloroflexota bacterium]|jgi:acetoin utilization deacetylase AcuC-like enzyme